MQFVVNGRNCWSPLNPPTGAINSVDGVIIFNTVWNFSYLVGQRFAFIALETKPYYNKEK